MKNVNIKIDGKTLVYGIIGNPVSHSFSPWMQSWFFRKQGINAVYCPFEISPENLRKALIGLKALNVQGINVTVPYKQKVIPALDTISPEAQIIGAVNTVILKHGKLDGHNTDGYGFLKSLVTQGQILPDAADFLIFGLGGAARAIIYTLAREKARKITISSRNRARATSFCREINHNVGEDICESVKTYSQEFESRIKDVDVIVNCSPLGLSPDDPLPFSPEICREGTVIFDLIYNPLRTPLLKKAQKCGLPVINGLGMLVFQGMQSFKLWTGKSVTPYFDTIYYELSKNVEGK